MEFIASLVYLYDFFTSRGFFSSISSLGEIATLAYYVLIVLATIGVIYFGVSFVKRIYLRLRRKQPQEPSLRWRTLVDAFVTILLLVGTGYSWYEGYQIIKSQSSSFGLGWLFLGFCCLVGVCYVNRTRIQRKPIVRKPIVTKTKEISVSSTQGLLKRFDRRLQDAKDAKSEYKIEMLNDLTKTLRDLIDLPWDIAQSRINDILDMCEKLLSSPEYTESCLKFLDLIIWKYPNETICLVKKRFPSMIELYNPRTRNNPLLLTFLQRLHMYEEIYMMNLVNDAVHLWPKEACEDEGLIQLDEIKDFEALDSIGKQMQRVMNNAQESEEARSRAKRFYRRVRDILASR